ncbi:metallophosphoesterase family protein [Lichenibacterium dinghuense]|uniref:metallophosphoesterase family protein n=1 Tax=Lichenibacterium dinghuense TaxID=2895977 RepID=UPI00272DCB63|nr:DNA repair exonuclease [Lichenibacterium sp. 6Y81]
MTDEFTFLHAADLHLDSPLLGLSSRAADLASRVGQASRRAFDRLVDLAIEERCPFVVLAGDTFDGDLRDYRSGLFFLAGMNRLRGAGIKVYMIAGNHDAANRWFDKLTHTDNVRRFDHRAAHTFLDDDLRVAVHGRSFPRRDVAENLAASYPAPHPSYFNVGVLHTACQGGGGENAAYAPCTLEQLVNHGYDYWALGHVHARQILNEHPHVVHPGNIQGRSVRETGSKGVTLVRVSGGVVRGLEHRDVADVRWVHGEVDLTGAVDAEAARSAIRTVLEGLAATAADRSLALRLVLRGETPLHAVLVRDPAGTREDVEVMASTLSATVWLERVEVRTRRPMPTHGADPTVAGRLADEVRRLGEGREVGALVERCLGEIRTRMPAGARFDDLAARIRREVVAGGVDLALSTMATEEGTDALR